MRIANSRIFVSFLVLAVLRPAICRATEVQVVALTPGRSARVVIDRGTAVTIQVGETVDTVKLLRADRGSAVLSVDGATITVSLASATTSAGNAAATGSITLVPDANGQFFASGSVNGRPVRFLVDTGASVTTLSRADAQRIGLRYRDGVPTQSMTVNGRVKGWQIALDSLRVGDVTVHDVIAVVVDNDLLPFGLLGMTYLDHFEIQRQGTTLVLRRRR